MLALYAAAVFPANIKHAVYNVQLPQLPTSWWYHAPRLALQPVVLWWALYCSQVVNWPFSRHLARSSDASGDKIPQLLHGSSFPCTSVYRKLSENGVPERT
jgi:hypothetical protein